MLIAISDKCVYASLCVAALFPEFRAHRGIQKKKRERLLFMPPLSVDINLLQRIRGGRHSETSALGLRILQEKPTFGERRAGKKNREIESDLCLRIQNNH